MPHSTTEHQIVKTGAHPNFSFCKPLGGKEEERKTYNNVYLYWKEVHFLQKRSPFVVWIWAIANVRVSEKMAKIYNRAPAADV